MFKYEKIPNIQLTDIVKISNNRIFKNIPNNLINFCKAIEEDPYFYAHHTSLFLGSKTVQNFRLQIYSFLESIDAVEYSIHDSLHNACIPAPLAITFQRKYPINTKHIWTIQDISDIYDLKSGKLWLPPHHQAKVTQFGKVPENVAETLRSYIKYVLKCKDKDFYDLQLELNTLINSGILDNDFYNQLISEQELKKNHFAKEKE